MHEYVTLSDFIANLKYFKHQLLADHTVEIFYIVDENGEGVEHYVWHGKLKDCVPDNPVFKNYRYLWNDLSVYGCHVIDICCARVKE
jgi:hypothetical protein